MNVNREDIGHADMFREETIAAAQERWERWASGECTQFQRAQRVVECVSSMIDWKKPLDIQHDIKLLWHKDNLAAVLRGHPFAARPITVELDPTNDCSYNCSFCTYGFPRRHTAELAGTRFMSREAMALVMRRLSEGRVKGVIITGGGEPLENPETPFAFESARQLGLQTGLFTNGSLLTSELAERILTACPQFVRVSANAVTPDVYVKFHGLDDERWAHVTWDNIRSVAKLVCGSLTSFGLGVVINRINADDLIPLFERALEIVAGGGRIDYVAVRPVVNYTGRVQISPDVVARAKKACAIGQRLVEGSALKIFVAAEYFDEVAAAGQRDLPPPTPGHCVGHPWMASVGYTGDVYLCSEGKYNARNRLGSLLTQTLEEIWESALRQRVICDNCQRPPVCKAHRLTTRIDRLLEYGPLCDDEVAVVEDFLSEVRAAGSPGGVEFL